MVLKLAQSRDLQSHSPVSGQRGAGDGIAPSWRVRSTAGRGCWTDGHQAGASILLCGSRHMLRSHLWPPSACSAMSGEPRGPGHCRPCREKMACGQERGQEQASPEPRLCFRPPLQLGLLSFLALLPADLAAPLLPALIQNDYFKEDLPWQPDQKSGLGE